MSGYFTTFECQSIPKCLAAVHLAGSLHLLYSEGVKLMINNNFVDSESVSVIGRKSEINKIAVRGNRIYTGHSDGGMDVWDFDESGKLNWIQSLGSSLGSITEVIITDDEFICVSSRGLCGIYCSETFLQRKQINLESIYIHSITASNKGKIIALGGSSRIYLYDKQFYEHITTLGNHSGPVSALSIYSDQYTDELILISGGEDKKIFLWDLIYFTLSDQLNIHSSKVTCVNTLGNSTSAFHHYDNSALLVSSSRDKKFKLTNLRTKELVGVVDFQVTYALTFIISTHFNSIETANRLYAFVSCSDKKIYKINLSSILNYNRRKNFLLCLSSTGMIKSKPNLKYSVEELAKLSTAMFCLTTEDIRVHICAFI